jgi:hypothetical protein
MNVLTGHPNAYANDLEVVIHREKVCSQGYAGIGDERALPKRHQ